MCKLEANVVLVIFNMERTEHKKYKYENIQWLHQPARPNSHRSARICAFYFHYIFNFLLFLDRYNIYILLVSYVTITIFLV